MKFAQILGSEERNSTSTIVQMNGGSLIYSWDIVDFYWRNPNLCRGKFGRGSSILNNINVGACRSPQTCSEPIWRTVVTCGSALRSARLSTYGTNTLTAVEVWRWLLMHSTNHLFYSVCMGSLQWWSPFIMLRIFFPCEILMCRSN